MNLILVGVVLLSLTFPFFYTIPGEGWLVYAAVVNVLSYYLMNRPSSSGVQFSRAQGASSGAESVLIAHVIVFCAVYPLYSLCGVAYVLLGMLVAQVLVMDHFDRQIVFYGCMSQQFGPSIMRNGSIGFAQCVRPGGRPTERHSLEMYALPAWLTACIFTGGVTLVLCVNPVIALVRLFYPEHHEGVNKGRWTELFLLFVRHPLVVQGEGPSNGDGLAAMCASESIVYPTTPRQLEHGPADSDYWKSEGHPRLKDMFHDKLFCHRFFRSCKVPHPILMGEVVDHVQVQTFRPREQAPAKMIWKPRYSTMSLGVEHFTGWEPTSKGTWAPSTEPYVIEEYVASTEFPQAAEWYRMPTLWAYDEAEPKLGYIWRTRNKPADERVQTDIIGGAYCVPRTLTPFVGPTEQGCVIDPRTGSVTPIDPQVEKALTRALQLAREMHKQLGRELFSIGWDILIRDDTPIFIEFNINNGFFVADHSVEEVQHMIAYYRKEFNARLGPQLVNFDPYKADEEALSREQ